MIVFIEELRSVFGVGPICRVLGIAPSTFYAHKAVEHDPDLASSRAKRDQLEEAAIKRVHDASGLCGSTFQLHLHQPDGSARSLYIR